MANWHDFEKYAAEYFDTSHQVFEKLDSRTVEKQNERLIVPGVSRNWLGLLSTDLATLVTKSIA